MIGYVTFGTNDLDRAGKFYDALLTEIGATRLMEREQKALELGAVDERPPGP
jgi:catechol 2,3-dioxygenase-like lactoylglutathione lyase family enzyme